MYKIVKQIRTYDYNNNLKKNGAIIEIVPHKTLSECKEILNKKHIEISSKYKGIRYNKKDFETLYLLDLHNKKELKVLNYMILKEGETNDNFIK